MCVDRINRFLKQWMKTSYDVLEDGNHRRFDSIEEDNPVTGTLSYCEEEDERSLVKPDLPWAMQRRRRTSHGSNP